MKRLFNELIISYHGYKLSHSSNLKESQYHMNKMFQRIRNRDDEQIKRMEAKKGLI